MRSVDLEPFASTSLADRGATENVLDELLAEEHRAHERAEDDDSGACRNPEGPATGDAEVIQRVLRPALTDEEGYSCGDSDDCESKDNSASA
ncbi:MAG: hypothetical protein QUS09_03325, partial [Methanotrichaceae archaeon]|nr:hypothetical protein [Methanotrichaceae archaeon]